jgi:hypothetical protein
MWRRVVVGGPLVLLLALVTLFALWDVAAPPLVGAMFAGHGIPALDVLLEAHRRADPAYRDVAYYVRNGRTALGQGIIAATGLTLLAIALVRWRRVVQATRAFFGATGPALNLAVFRIVLFAVWLADVEMTPVAFYARLPRVLLDPPAGLGWFAAYVPVGPAVVGTMLLVFRVACVLAVVGLFTRAATLVALASGAYANAVAQTTGALYADHHLLWFAALLASSPCGDALSIDARRRPEPPPARAYALPLRFGWILFCVMYFFPGFWKVWRTGLAWVSADNVRDHMYLKWREFGDWTPALRVDHVRPLLWASAIGTIAFELGFVAVALTSRLRPLVVAAGLLFHNTTWLLLRIHFWTLQASYVALVDWAALLGRRAAAASTAIPWATAVVGAILVAGAVGTGTRLVPLSWPFTVYPTFASIAQTTRPELTVMVVDGAGTERAIDLRAANARAREGFQWDRLRKVIDSILGVRDPAAQETRLRALWALMTDADPSLRDAAVVRFYRDENATDPERRPENPLSRTPILELRR